MTAESIIARIRALREKTTARGCTEAEAAAAAAKVAEMMREHGLCEADVVMTSAEARQDTMHGVRDVLWRIVAHYTNTAGLHARDDAGRRVIRFIGAEPWPLVAAYLKDLLNGAIDYEIRAFKRGAFYRRRRNLSTRRAAVADFTHGMVARLAEMLHAHFAPTLDDDARGRAVAHRDSLPALVIVQHRQAPGRFGEATAEGWLAGGRVKINDGVAGDGDTPLLEGR